MRVLMAHNRYLEGGGEDLSTAAEVDLLRAHGCEVTTYERSNEDVAAIGAWRTGLKAVWNQETYTEIRRLLAAQKFDIVHVQNFFPLISPAIYYAARHAGVPVVQSMRNYRLACVNGLHLRNGRACEDCLGKTVPWRGVVRRCYRDSAPASAAVASMITLHKLARTWDTKVDRYIALTQFARAKLIEAGLPAAKISVKPNFITHDPGRGEGGQRHVVYVGRLAPEKGVDVLIDAWRRAKLDIPLLIVGTGPLEDELRARCADMPSVKFLGRQTIEQVYRAMGQSLALALPSVFYEGMPRTLIEAFATATPVIATDHGSMSEMIEPYITGLFVEPGDAAGLGNALAWAAVNRPAMRMMGDQARQTFETTYSGEANVSQLIGIYREAGGGDRAIPSAAIGRAGDAITP
jgi:glycosyltransferase involved in cell wall biosynthesis